MTVMEIYAGSNGNDTIALYDRLAKLGVIGIVALNLFRAQKSSARAKVYRCRFKGLAYDKKNWSLSLLHAALVAHAAELQIEFGWREDPLQEYHKWVLYIDLPNGQISFHAASRMGPRDYAAPWNNELDSATRIIRFVESVLEREQSLVAVMTGKAPNPENL